MKALPGDGHAAGPEACRSHVGAEVVALLLAAAVVIFLIVNRRDVPDAFAAVREARLGWLALALLASAAFVTAYGMARRASMLAFDVHLAPRRAVLTGAIAQGLNIVTKSGGMAGAAVYRDEARRAHHSPALVLGGYVLAVVLGDLAFALTLLASLLLLIVDGRFTRVDAIAAGIFGLYFLVTVSAVVAAARSRSAIRRIHAIPARLRRRTPDHESADELFDAVQRLRRRPRAALTAFGWMVAIEALGVAMVWLCLAAYGYRTGLTVAVVGYGISVLFSIVAFLPAGLGFAEASLGAVLVSFDVPGAVAAVVVITYRLLETWISLGVSLFVAWWWRRHRPHAGSASEGLKA
jgi:uncharacterized protein (TIRG00374 family)